MKSLTSLTPNLDLVSEFIKETGDNPMHAELRKILNWWGPNGERWGKGYSYDKDGVCTNACAAGAMGELRLDRSLLQPLLEAAAVEMGFSASHCIPKAYFACSDSGFPNARQMVLRAISLSA